MVTVFIIDVNWSLEFLSVQNNYFTVVIPH